MTARGQAGDCLLPLPVRRPRKQDGWPDGEPGRVWRRLPLSLLWLLGQRWMLRGAFITGRDNPFQGLRQEAYPWCL